MLDLKGRIATDLRPAEEKWLSENTPKGKDPQDLIRAIIYLASRDEEIQRRAHVAADQRLRLGEEKPRTWTHLTEEAVRTAVQEAGSLSGAARMLGAHRSSVRYVCAEHGIHVPSMGRAPEQLEKYK